MATLAQRTQTVEERTNRLESILASFMERTDNSIERLERAIERMEQEGARDREESARFRAEMARERREMNKRWGELANKMGTVVEDIVAPSIQRLSRAVFARAVFDCGEPQFFGTRVSLSHLADAARHLRHRDEVGVSPSAHQRLRIRPPSSRW